MACKEIKFNCSCAKALAKHNHPSAQTHASAEHCKMQAILIRQVIFQAWSTSVCKAEEKNITKWWENASTTPAEDSPVVQFKYFLHQKCMILKSLAWPFPGAINTDQSQLETLHPSLGTLRRLSKGHTAFFTRVAMRYLDKVSHTTKTVHRLLERRC